MNRVALIMRVAKRCPSRALTKRNQLCQREPATSQDRLDFRRPELLLLATLLVAHEDQ